ncbi:MAG: CinA family nicotinamide mononucleotide deamidase-related protein [Phycisphaerales bacterium]
MRQAHATAAILSIGDELTLGQTLDTNSKWVSERLVEFGIVPVEHTTVPDDLDAQAAAFKRLSERAELVICTGGLGPTADDLTRAALAAALGCPLVEDEIALAGIEAFFEARGRSMPVNNRTQAQRPAIAMSLPNLCGTAPGLAATFPNQCDVFCVPGPPSELRSMFQHQVVPRLRPRAGVNVLTRCLHCFAIGESELAQRLGSLMDRDRNPLVGTTASGGVVSCRIRYEGTEALAHASSLMAETEREVRARAGSHVFGSDGQTLQEAVVLALTKLGAKLGTVESCTGGLVSRLITDVPGSSTVFRGGLVCYSNDLKVSLAGVEESLLRPDGPGAVSPEVVSAMARGGLERLGADICIAVTGIAGPGGAVPSRGDSPAKPVGLVFVGVAMRPELAAKIGAAELDTRAFRHMDDRVAVREWSAKCGLAMVWFALTGAQGVRMLRQIEWPPASKL